MRKCCASGRCEVCRPSGADINSYQTWGLAPDCRKCDDTGLTETPTAGLPLSMFACSCPKGQRVAAASDKARYDRASEQETPTRSCYCGAPGVEEYDGNWFCAECI